MFTPKFKKMILSIMVIIITISIFPSCDREKESILTKNEELLIKTWNVTSWEITENGTTDIVFPDQDFKNAKIELTFNEDGGYVIIFSITAFGFTKKEKGTGTWSFNEEETQINLSSIEAKSSLMKILKSVNEIITFDIIVLTDSKLHIISEVDNEIEEIIAV